MGTDGRIHMIKVKVHSNSDNDGPQILFEMKPNKLCQTTKQYYHKPYRFRFQIGLC